MIEKITKTVWYKYLVIIGVLLVPFVYGFFYLKAYWDPYGVGNIDNLPIAIVNEDTDTKGDKLIDAIKKSGKLKVNVLNYEEASDGLYEGKYYALLLIPEDFGQNMEDANSKNHPTITYMPNQKANYLASQIITNAINKIEKKLDNEVNSEIVNNLSTSIINATDSLEEISDGFSKLNNATSELKNGANKLNNNYFEFNTGISKLNDGSKDLYNGTLEIEKGINDVYIGSKNITDNIQNKINELENNDTPTLDDNTINKIKEEAINSVNENIDINSIGISAISSVKETYQKNIDNITNAFFSYGINDTNLYCNSNNINDNLLEYCISYKKLVDMLNDLEDENSILYNSIYNTATMVSKNTSITVAENVSENVSKKVADSVSKEATNRTIDSLNNLNSYLNDLSNGLYKLNNGINTISDATYDLSNGSNTLYNNSLLIENGINAINTATNILDSSITNSKDELNKNIDDKKEDIDKLNDIDEYSNKPININTKEINSVSSYGTAFAPLFISIALWVGCLMIFVAIYCDKEDKFKLLGSNNPNKIQRTMLYHLLISISAILLGLSLELLLDFNITNIFLYYFIIILIANTFMAIIELLIVNFGDVGKFIGLIILILQLASSGGTFPIETVTKSFRFLNNLLPMKYTINLVKEALVVIENDILISNLLIVGVIFIIFFTINIINDIRLQRKNDL